MIKQKFDKRTLSDILPEEINNRMSVGDVLTLYFKLNGNNKPSVSIRYDVYDDHSHFGGLESYDDFVPDIPGFIEENLYDGSQNFYGPATWDEYIENLQRDIRALCRTRGAKFVIGDFSEAK